MVIFYKKLYVILLFTLILCNCSNKPGHRGYLLETPTSDLYGVVDPSSLVVVGPKVVAWNGYDKYLIIEKERHLGIYSSWDWADVDGYLLIDTTNGDVIHVESRGELNELAVKLGIPSEFLKLKGLYYNYIP